MLSDCGWSTASAPVSPICGRPVAISVRQSQTRKNDLNALAAGGCELRTRGDTIELISARLFPAQPRRGIRGFERQVLRVLGVADFLSLKPASTGQGDLTPCHFQRIADWGACRKTRVVLQNRRPDQERTKTWGHDVRVLLFCRRTGGNGARLPRRYRDDRALRVGSARGRRDAGRGRWRQGRAPGRAIADRRHPRAGWLLRAKGRF